MKILLSLAAVVILSACVNVQKTNVPKIVSISSATDSVKEIPDPGKAVADSNFFTQPVTIMITPSDRLINLMKKKTSEDDYNTILDDDINYMADSGRYLDSIKAIKVQRRSEGVLAFKSTSGQTAVTDLKEVFFGIILFNGKDRPVYADITAFVKDYEKYMGRR